MLVLNLEKVFNLHEETFNRLQNLQHLELLNGHLKQIKSKTFFMLTKLKYLFLNTNQIYNIKTSTFTGLSSIEELNLSHNHIKSFEFTDRKALAEYALDSTGRQNVPIIKRMISLKYIDLNSNKITILRQNSFEITGKLCYRVALISIIKSSMFTCPKSL